MRVYNYLFYKISQVVGLFTDSPTFGAIIVMCWLFIFNSFTLFYLFSKNYEISQLLDAYASIAGGILVFGGHLVYFYSKSRYIEIFDSHKNESNSSSITGFIAVFIYIFVSIWIHWVYVIPNIWGILK